MNQLHIYIYIYIYIYTPSLLKYPSFPGINSSWPWCFIFCIYCWIQRADILLKMFAFIFIKDTDLWFSFVVISLFWWQSPPPNTHDSSVGKESTCNAADPGLIPGSGRSTGEEIGYLLQNSLASLVAQLVKNLLAIWETWVWSLGWEDPLQKGKATHIGILAWRIPWTV